MITAFMSAGALHAVHVIHQKGLAKIRAIGVCTVEDDAGAGVYQVAPWVFDGRAKYGEIPVCPNCAQRVTTMLKVPPKS